MKPSGAFRSPCEEDAEMASRKGPIKANIVPMPPQPVGTGHSQQVPEAGLGDGVGLQALFRRGQLCPHLEPGLSGTVK